MRALFAFAAICAAVPTLAGDIHGHAHGHAHGHHHAHNDGHHHHDAEHHYNHHHHHHQGVDGHLSTGHHEHHHQNHNHHGQGSSHHSSQSEHHNGHHEHHGVQNQHHQGHEGQGRNHGHHHHQGASGGEVEADTAAAPHYPFVPHRFSQGNKHHEHKHHEHKHHDNQHHDQKHGHHDHKVHHHHHHHDHHDPKKEHHHKKPEEKHLTVKKVCDKLNNFADKAEHITHLLVAKNCKHGDVECWKHVYQAITAFETELDKFDTVIDRSCLTQSFTCVQESKIACCYRTYGEAIVTLLYTLKEKSHHLDGEIDRFIVTAVNSLRSSDYTFIYELARRMQCNEHIRSVMEKQGALDGTTKGSIREAFALFIFTPLITGDDFGGKGSYPEHHHNHPHHQHHQNQHQQHQQHHHQQHQHGDKKHEEHKHHDHKHHEHKHHEHKHEEHKEHKKHGEHHHHGHKHEEHKHHEQHHHHEHGCTSCGKDKKEHHN